MVNKNPSPISIIKRIYKDFEKADDSPEQNDLVIYGVFYILILSLILLIFPPLITGYIYYYINNNTVGYLKMYGTGFFLDCLIIYVGYLLYNFYKMYKKEKLSENGEITVGITVGLFFGLLIVSSFIAFGYYFNAYILKMEKQENGQWALTAFVSMIVFLLCCFIVNSIIYCRGYYKKTKQLLIEEGIQLSQ